MLRASTHCVVANEIVLVTKFLLDSRNTCHKRHKNQAGCFLMPDIAQLRKPGIKGYSVYTTTWLIFKFCT